jgi:hypothetical protein
MKHAMRSLLVLAATSAAVLAVTAGSSAAAVTPDQLTQAGWTCVQPLADPTRRICAPPGLGLPPLPGTPGFADRGPSYELLVFQFATGEFIGVQHLLRPDIYLKGTPPCPQQARWRVHLHPAERHLVVFPAEVALSSLSL